MINSASQADSAATDAYFVRTVQRFNYIVGPSGQLVGHWNMTYALSGLVGSATDYLSEMWATVATIFASMAQVLELSRTMISLNVTATLRRRSWPSLGGSERNAGTEIIADGVERQLKHNSLALTGAHT